MNKKLFNLKNFFIILLSFILTFSYFYEILAVENTYSKEVESFIINHFNIRNNCFFSNDTSQLIKNYDISEDDSNYSLDHEINRINYLKNWTEEHAIKLYSIKSIEKFRKIATDNNYSKVLLDEQFIINYKYEKDSSAKLNTFTTNLFHICELKKVNGKWIFIKDWYLDSFENSLKSNKFK